MPPWEIAAHGGDVRAHRNRAAQASALTGGRLRVRPAGPCGYDVSTRTGKQWMVGDVDGLAVVLRDHGGPDALAAAVQAVNTALGEAGSAESGAAHAPGARGGCLTPEEEKARAQVPVAWALVETASEH